MAITLDMRKAYDMLEFYFTRKGFNELGFVDRSIDSLMPCVTTHPLKLLL